MRLLIVKIGSQLRQWLVFEDGGSYGIGQYVTSFCQPRALIHPPALPLNKLNLTSFIISLSTMGYSAEDDPKVEQSQMGNAEL